MKLLVLVFTLAAVAAPSSGLTCHSCGYLIGVGDYDCEDPFVPGTVDNVTCDDGWYCKKGYALNIDGIRTLLSRTCEQECSTGCIDFFGSTLCGHCCQSDFCNSATNVQFNIVTFLASLGIAAAVILF